MSQCVLCLYVAFFPAYKLSYIYNMLHLYTKPCSQCSCIQRAIHEPGAQADPVDIWLIAPVENLSEFPAVFLKGKGNSTY